MPSIYYLNALFDLQLHRRPIPAALGRSAAQMQCLFLCVAGPDDRVLIEDCLDENYFAYLRDRGIGEAQPIGPSQRAPGYTARVWGWSDEAVCKMECMGADCLHPPLDVVHRVNGRRFCYEVGREEGMGVPQTRWCERFEDVRTAVARMAPGPKVLKAPYGTAGHGFIWLDSENDVLAQKQVISDVCVGQGGAIVEPWMDRIVDIGSIAEVTREGHMSRPRHHRNLSNRAGAFYGDWIDPHDPLIAPWRQRLDQAMRVTAQRLAQAGYWGVFGCDTFLYRDKDGTTQPAPVFEINARCPMSVVAYGVKDRIAPDTPGLFRFISRRRHNLPSDYKTLNQIFTPLCRDGADIILLTPLRIKRENAWKQPARSAFFLHAPCPEQLERLDEKLRKVVE